MLLAESLLGTSSIAANYIEDVFSTYLYTGTGSSQTITNGVDLSTKGGMVWIKSRSAATSNFLFDTARGTTKEINSDTTDAQATLANSLTAFNTDGFTVNSATGIGVNNATYASWTFRKQAKFFDVVTYTGTGSPNTQTINHNLGSVPGCIIVKNTTVGGNDSPWVVYHRKIDATSPQTYYLLLNTTASRYTDGSGTGVWVNAPTSTQFTVGTSDYVNKSGSTYVAYLFAHDAGGFGAAGTDNVISCGSYTGTGNTSLSVNLGYEPQWIMIKNSTTEAASTGWYIQDNMRGMSVDNAVDNGVLYANLSNAESLKSSHIVPTATGFTCSASDADFNSSGVTYIYIAIRRGPMKTPTSGTSVLDMQTYTGTQAARTITTANTVDLSFTKSRSTSGTRWNWTDRLRGATLTLNSSLMAAEAIDSTGYTSFAVQKGYTLGTGDTYDVNTSGRTYISWNFTRAPGFFDEVCYKGNGQNGQTISHNLTVSPELLIVKCRNVARSWNVWSAYTGANYYATLQTTDQFTNATGPYVFGTMTSTTFTAGYSGYGTNTTGENYVAYLFATVAGVSKVGTYTGTGTTKQIDCGFTGGARFVLIKRTDSTGDWYVWDSTRGIVAGNDPYLLLNSTAAEVTNTDYVDTYSAGFEISSTAPTEINASGGTFIFLAIA